MFHVLHFLFFILLSCSPPNSCNHSNHLSHHLHPGFPPILKLKLKKKSHNSFLSWWITFLTYLLPWDPIPHCSAPPAATSHHYSFWPSIILSIASPSFSPTLSTFPRRHSCVQPFVQSDAPSNPVPLSFTIQCCQPKTNSNSRVCNKEPLKIFI